MFNTNSNVPSLSDIAAVTGNNDGFGGNNGWWILIILFAIFGGWGNNGCNNPSNTAANVGALDNYVLSSDFASLSRQIDSATSSLERKGDTINAGLCDGFYAMNSGMLNGFAGVNSAITTTNYDALNAIQQSQIAAMQNTNALQTQLSNCCCENREAISGVNYNMASTANDIQQNMANGFCQSNFNLQTTTRDLMDNQNSNTQAILTAINQMNSDTKDAKIADLTSQIQALNLAASQSAQNSYLISQIRPSAVPAYVVSNPYNGYGYSCGCGSCNS